MSSRERILTQSRRLLNNRRWGAAYRDGRPAAPAPRPHEAALNAHISSPSAEARPAGIVVLELASRQVPARS